MRPLAASAIGLAVAAVSLTGGAAATAKAAATKGAKPKPTIVSVVDFYFGPDTATIKKGGSIKWVWASTNVEPHDVHLKKGPKGLKKPGHLLDQDDRGDQCRIQEDIRNAGHLQLHLHDPPDQDEADGDGQEVGPP